MPWWIALLNSLAALTSTGFGVAAVIRPSSIAPPREERTPTRFFPAMYAGRAVPLGLSVAVAVWLTPVGAVLLLLLGVALVAQVADVVIGAGYRLPGMIAGAAFAIICHVAAIVALAR